MEDQRGLTAVELMVVVAGVALSAFVGFRLFQANSGEVMGRTGDEVLRIHRASPLNDAHSAITRVPLVRQVPGGGGASADHGAQAPAEPEPGWGDRAVAALGALLGVGDAHAASGPSAGAETGSVWTTGQGHGSYLPQSDQGTPGPPHTVDPVDRAELAAAIAAADEARRQQLALLSQGRFDEMTATAPAAREGLDARIGEIRFGATNNRSEEVGLRQLRDIGGQEGFGVGLHSGSERPDSPISDQYLHPQTQWTNWEEDPSHFHQDGTLSAAPDLFDPDPEARGLGSSQVREKRAGDHTFDEAVISDRIERYYPNRSEEYEQALADQGIDALIKDGWIETNFPLAADMRPTAVGERSSGDDGIEKALQNGWSVRRSLTYVEGGDKVVGTDANGDSYVLIGRDSVAINRTLLTREMGRPVSDQELQVAFAKDYGVSPDQVHYIEAPGAYHLDVGMTAWSDGTVLLNDADQAAEQQIAHMRSEHERLRPEEGSAKMDAWRAKGERLERDAETLRAVAEQRMVLEDMAERDLRDAGLDVVRVPGRYADPRRRRGEIVDEMNFLNGEGGEGANGGSYFITNGGEEWAQQDFVESVTPHSPEPVRVYFLDRRFSRGSLLKAGGIRCRTMEVPPADSTSHGGGRTEYTVED